MATFKSNRRFYEIRESLLELFTNVGTRPWLQHELQVEVIRVDSEQSFQYNDSGVKSSVKYSNSVREEDSLNKYTSVLQSIGLPNLGLGFVHNQAMIGTPIPQVSFGAVDLQLAVPVKENSNDILTINGESSRLAKYMGVWGALYDEQFTTSGLLRVRSAKNKPIVLIKLVSTDIRNTRSGTPFSFILYGLQHCRFNMPMVTSGSSSSQDLLGFKVQIIFENYVILPKDESSVFEMATSGYIDSVVAKNEIDVDDAMKVVKDLGSQFNINF